MAREFPDYTVSVDDAGLPSASDRDYGDLVFREGLPPPPAILFFRQAPYAPDHPADLTLALLSQPHLTEGCMVVGERNIRRKPFPPV